MAKKIGVLLAGCGHLDGAEIHEATITLLALDRGGADIKCMAPNKSQMHTINHKSGDDTGEVRNVLTEASRIARGNIADVADVKADELDGLILPGGYGAAKNLVDFAVRGADCTIHPEVDRLLNDMVKAKKPVGVICIAPAVMARAMKNKGIKVRLTIGNDKGTAEALETLGAKHVDCAVDDIVVDETNKVVSTPAYMLGPSIKNVADGIEKLVAKVLEMA
ncbi:isoprenoid biosynthesis protein ElbB [candidate division LCP-89 bacterium B3_LCP]|uniref:Isoprenoid biosynthesis protein ElbB n=1 Tax=candidate division LCP-89 bacterium B3_LCP TaxID=2012998 RepID=A0A532V0R7_UNCL8|nr:MAG: isoprenoid biosynthesis protein ElbB [candidate division LCP-89 bacterium B3_LCP]